MTLLTTKLKKYGNSYGVLIPRQIITAQELQPKDLCFGYQFDLTGLIIAKRTTDLSGSDTIAFNGVKMAKFLSDENLEAMSLKITKSGTGDVILFSQAKLEGLSWLPQELLTIDSTKGVIRLQPITGWQSYSEPDITAMTLDELRVAYKLIQARIQGLVENNTNLDCDQTKRLSSSMILLDTLHEAWKTTINQSPNH